MWVFRLIGAKRRRYPSTASGASVSTTAVRARRVRVHRPRAEKARENERRRIKRAHTELKKALQTANESVRTYTNALFINMLKEEVPPETLVKGINKLDRHCVLLKELQVHLATLSGLGISINHGIRDWHDPLQLNLRELAKTISSKTEGYATLQHQGGS